MLTALYDITIYPIELLVNYVYAFFFRFTDSHGLAIVGISIAITILSFPLYNIAEKIQQSERDVRKRLQGGVDRIKAVFSGDEQYMILNTYYKQHNYHPSYALRSSVSLLIQVPFFMAAYFFLSNLASLQGVPFLFINDLGQPDGLLNIGGLTLNFLPIAMTVINIVAGLIYTKGFLIREKVQLFGMALLFLVLLYTSPAGLVLYWTLNNVFSLIKNIFYKLKEPALVLYLVTATATIVGLIWFFINFPGIVSLKRNVVLLGGVLIICIPLELKAAKWMFSTFLTPLEQDKKQRIRLYVVSALLLWILCGLFIPSSLIASSPLEFAFTGIVGNPLSYIAKTAVVFLGLAVVWPLAIYAMASVSAKVSLAFGLGLFAFVALINATVFQGNYGIISNFLVFDNADNLFADTFMTVVPILVTFALFVLLLVFVRKGKSKWVSDLLVIIAIASLALSLYHIWTINRDYREHKQYMLANQDTMPLGDEQPIYHLSKEGTNVIVFFLDRAVGAYFPYIMQDIPELASQLDGFVYYPNTVSFGPHTLLGSPALMGGYEYTPEAINKKTEQALVEKHNESMLLVPRLFYEAGYEVTVSDPPLSNYKWSGGYSAFDAYPEMNVFSVLGKYTNRYLKEHFSTLSEDDVSSQVMTNLPRFSLFRIAFPVLRTRLYDQGQYFSIIENDNAMIPFLDMYSSLYYLPDVTDYTGQGNTFTFIDNETPHRPVSLELPDFEPKMNAERNTAPIGPDQDLSKFDIQTYQVNATSMKRIGIWLEKLQRDGVYDNTRIIIVADHGAPSYNPILAGFENYKLSQGYYNPLLLVKDFNSTGPVKHDTTFMTNADTSLLAIEGLEVSSINPFTGKDLYDQVDKDLVHVIYGGWAPEQHGPNTFSIDYGQSFSVKDDISVEDNWDTLQTNGL